MQSWPIVVIGAGAAGLLAATFAARRGHRVLLLDSRRQPGAKIRVSGGGRCNVLPSVSELHDFETRGSYPVVRNVLATWPRADVQRFFEDELGVKLCQEPSGKLFPQSNESKEVVAALLRAVAEAGVTTRFGVCVHAVSPPSSGTYRLSLEDGSTLEAGRVVMATGGLSMPRTGSDGSGWQMLSRLGHGLTTPVPALVPLHGEPFKTEALAGLSVPARLTWRRGSERLWSKAGDFLFTHKGYSGPVVLDASRHWTLAHALRETADPAMAPTPTLVATFGEAAHAECARTFWQQRLLQAGQSSVASVVRAAMPRRLADALLAQSGLGAACEGRASALRRSERKELEERLSHVALPVSSSEGYRTAEVTSGGVPLKEIYYQSLESRLHKGLYLCGETLDVTGRLGGFNFLWAWVTGRLAGEAAAAGLEDVRQAG